MNILKALKEYRERSLRKKIVFSVLKNETNHDLSISYCREMLRFIKEGIKD